MNILLCSAGRRPYLVRWFREALVDNGLDGRIIVADSDPHAPARQSADTAVTAPLARDKHYRDWLGDLIVSEGIDLAVSFNDFELSEWSRLTEEAVWGPLVRMAPDVQNLVEDKYALYLAFQKLGIDTPESWLGGSAPDGIAAEGQYITKGRYGSASRGLRHASPSTLTAVMSEALREVTDRQGNPSGRLDPHEALDLVLVQDRVLGEEYGLDVVCDLTGNFAGVLARRKLAMRGGETDRALTVDPAEFEDTARRIAAAVPHPGTIDVDIIVDSQGRHNVIDINPRFGGGYPFSHLAGARVPSAYVAWASGGAMDESWLRYETNVMAGKTVEAVIVG